MARALPHHPPGPIAGNQPVNPDWDMWFELLGQVAATIVFYSPSLTPASVAANSAAEETFTVTGLKTADTLVVNMPGATADLGLVNARVSAVDTLALTFMNTSGGSRTPPAGAYKVVAMRASE